MSTHSIHLNVQSYVYFKIPQNISCSILHLVSFNRLGLTQNLEPTHEHRTFHSAGTVDGPSSWNAYIKLGITLQMEVC